MLVNCLADSGSGNQNGLAIGLPVIGAMLALLLLITIVALCAFHQRKRSHGSRADGEGQPFLRQGIRESVMYLSYVRVTILPHVLTTCARLEQSLSLALFTQGFESTFNLDCVQLPSPTATGEF